MSASPSPRDRERLSAVELGVLVLGVLACRLLAMRACPIYDDAFITFRYAKNLADGAGMVFNPGAAWEPVLGTTTPMFGLVLSFFARLGLDLASASRGFDVACDLASAVLLARGLGSRRLPATMALVLFAALPWLDRISVGGMEAPFFCVLAIASSSLLAASRPGWAGFVAALACTVRPEGVLLVGVSALELLRRPRELLVYVVPVGVVGLAAIAILNRAYGFPIPQSVLAKAHMRASSWERIEPVLVQSFAPHAVLWVLFPVAILGWTRLLRERHPLRAFVGFALAITASYVAARPHVWGWYFYVPLAGWVVAVAVGGAEIVERWIAPRAPSLVRGLERATAPVAVLAAALVAWRAPTPVPENVYAPMLAWARTTSEREPDARILASDVGAIGWAWRGTVLDSEGLTCPPALDFPHPNAMIHAWEPEYLLVVAERDRVAPIYGDADIRARYEPVERFSPSGARELEPSVESLPPRWAQDYLVFRRKAVPR